MDGREDRLDELAVSRAWNAQWLRPHALHTTDGQPLTVVYRGRWTFGFGPDFQGAMIAFGPELRQGDVEIHLRPQGWRDHGHHLNPAYNGVILHVVLEGEPHPVPGAAARGSSDSSASAPAGWSGARPCRRQDGQLVPTLVLGPALHGSLDRLPADPTGPPLGSTTDRPCSAEITPANAAAALALLERAGDARLTAKAATFEASLTVMPPGQILYDGLLDALGYSRNRAPMRALAAALPLARIEERLAAHGGDEGATFQFAAAILLGVAGLLPLDALRAELAALSPDETAAIEAKWGEIEVGWSALVLPPEGWSLARVRPANHPTRRLLGLAAILARCARGGLLAACLESCLAEDPRAGLTELRALLLGPTRRDDPLGRFLGADRIAEIVINVVLPFALAYGTWAGDERLLSGAAALWDAVPASSGNEQVRALLGQIAGGAMLRPRTGRQQQGALHLWRHFCRHRRCYECPIARLAREG